MPAHSGSQRPYKLYLCTCNLPGTLPCAHITCQELCTWVVSVCYVRTYPYSCKSLFYVHINPKAYQWIPLLNHMRRPMLSCISRSKTYYLQNDSSYGRMKNLLCKIISQINMYQVTRKMVEILYPLSLRFTPAFTTISNSKAIWTFDTGNRINNA